MVRVAMAVLPLSANCSRKFSLDSFVSSDLRYPGVKDDVDFTCFSFVQSQWLVWLALTDLPLRSDLLLPLRMSHDSTQHVLSHWIR